MLEVGCGVGGFSKAVKDGLGAEVWGIEPNAEAAEYCRAVLDHVFVGSVESHIKDLPDGFFDCICMNDVIEHLVDPWAVLSALRVKLSKTGVIVASVPNVRHYKNLSDLLLRGEWEYTDSGILDKTHLRFFTAKSARRLFEESGYVVAELRGINRSRKFKLRMLNWLSFGSLWDISCLQFAIMVRPQKTI